MSKSKTPTSFYLSVRIGAVAGQIITEMRPAHYYVAMDNNVYGPFSLEKIRDLEVLSDTLICTDSADSSWRTASFYPEIRPYIQGEFVTAERNNMLNTNLHGSDQVSSQRSSYNDEDLFIYTQKRKAALIGVLTLGLAGISKVGIGETWRGNIFSGTSMDKGGLGFVLQIISFCFLSIIIAIPVFIISFVQLIYYSIKISSITN